MESGKTPRKRDRAARSSRSNNYFANLENVSDLSSKSETEQIVDTP